MNKSYALFLFLLLCSVSLSAQEVADSVFFLNGKVDVVRILKNSSEAIDCNYPNEDMISTISKSEIAKIVFRSGRVEICNEVSKNQFDELYFANGDIIQAKVLRLTDDSVDYLLPGEDLTRNSYITLISKIVFANGRIEEFANTLNIKVITDDSQWRDVVVSYNSADLRGLEQVGPISRASGWGGTLASGHGYNKAIESLQKEAAKMRCGLVYIVDAPNRGNTAYGAGTRVNAIAYRIRQSIDSSLRGLSDLADFFVDGSINQVPEHEAIDKAHDFADEILKDIENQEIQLAKEKYEILNQWMVGVGKKSVRRSLFNHVNRIDRKLH